MLGTFGALHLRPLARRPARAVAVVVTLALVTVAPVAIAVLTASARNGVAHVAALTGDVDLVVSGVTAGALDQTTLDAVADSAGVTAAAPLTITRAALNGESVLLYGSNLLLGDVAGDFGAALRDRVERYEQNPSLLWQGLFLGDALAHRLGVGPGDPLQIAAGHGVVGARVLEVVDGVALNDGDYAFGLLAYTQQLRGAERGFDAVLLAGDGDPDELRSVVLAGLDRVGAVRTPEAIAATATETLDDILRLMVFLSALVAAAGAFFVTGAVLLTMQDRRRELATRRALGTPRARLAWGSVAEFGLLGLVGALPGVALGVFVGASIVDRLPWSLVGEVGLVVPAVVPISALVVAPVLGVAVAVAAALPAVRRMLGASVEDELRGPRAEISAATRFQPTLVAVGAVALVGGLILVGGGESVLDALPPGLISVLVVGGFVALMRGVRGPGARALGRGVGRGGAAGVLARVGLARSPDRTWAILTAVSLGVATVTAVSGLTRDVAREFASRFDAFDDVTAVVYADPLNEPPRAATLPDRLAADLESLAGVERVAALRRVPAVIAGDPFELVGVTGDTAHPVVAAASDAARRALASSDAVVLSEEAATVLEVSAGERFALPTPTDARMVEVAAIVAVPLLQNDGLVVLSMSDLEAWFGPGGAHAYEVTARRDADPVAVRAEVETLVGDGATATSGAAVGRAFEQDVSLLTSAVGALELVVALAAALALLNLVLTSVVERREELALLRVVGATRMTVVRAVAVESAVHAAVGYLAGVLLGLTLHRAGTVTVSDLFDLPVPFTFRPSLLLTAAAVSLAIVVVGSVVPAVIAARTPVAGAS